MNVCVSFRVSVVGGVDNIFLYVFSSEWKANNCGLNNKTLHFNNLKKNIFSFHICWNFKLIFIQKVWWKFTRRLFSCEMWKLTMRKGKKVKKNTPWISDSDWRSKRWSFLERLLAKKNDSSFLFCENFSLNDCKVWLIG